MRLSRSAKVILGVVTALVFLFIYLPLLLVVVNSFNADRTFGWPPQGFTLEWWGRAFDSTGVREAVVSSLWVAAVSTIISLVLGTLLALALLRYKFFGRDVISLLVILPIALPGIVTGIALNNMFTTILGVSLSMWTVVIAHATFCMVTVFNNVIARLRRMQRRAWRRRPPIWAPACSPRSGWSRSRSSAPPCWPAGCWPSR